MRLSPHFLKIHLYRRDPVASQLEVREVLLAVEESGPDKCEAVPAEAKQVQEVKITEYPLNSTIGIK